jgi:recombination protein RecT
VSGQTIGGALAVRDNSPTAVVQQSKDQFAMVLPSHMRPEAFVRVAVGVLRRNPRLAKAAQNDMGAFMAAMMDAARLGLEPGTEQYWLIPRYDKRVGKEVVSGQKGYQGEVELIYRAGATASVMCEVVYEGDEFVWNPGSLDNHVPPRWNGPQDRPLHNIDWKDKGRKQRPMEHVYAYGLMKSGGVSKVIVLTRDEVLKAKAVNKTKDGDDAPWVKWPESMWLKTGLHRLSKFVPTSSEYIGVKPGPGAMTAVQVPMLAPAAPAMPSTDQMWEEVAVGHDHEDDDFHQGCEGCAAESAAADQAAATS